MMKTVYKNKLKGRDYKIEKIDSHEVYLVEWVIPESRKWYSIAPKKRVTVKIGSCSISGFGSFSLALQAIHAHASMRPIRD